MENAKWLEERRKGIGGSDISAIMGMNPWKTAYRVYQEKRKKVEDWQGNEATDWGKRLEPAIRQWYSDTTGRSVRLPEKIMYHEKYPFMLASLDGFTDDPRGVEIKTARSAKGWGEPGTNEIPDYYMLQVQHYMIVTAFPVFDVPVSIGGGSPELYEVPADKELQEMIIDAAADFWQRVIDANPPEPVSYADAVQRYGRASVEGIVTADEAAMELITELKLARAQAEAIEAVEESLKGKLIILLGEAGDTLASPAGEKLITYKLSKGASRFDAAAFARDHHDLYQQYLRTGEPTRRFLIKG